MAILTQSIPRTPPPAIATFNFTDIASQTGYVTFFGSKGDDGEYIASQVSVASEEITTFIEDQNITTSFVKFFDIDFDITFNLPRDIKGDLIASIPMGISAASATAAVFSFFCVVKAVHYDGNTETVIGTWQSKTTIATIETDIVSFRARTHLLKVNIGTLKHFKRDETVRIIVEVWYKRDTASGPAHIMIGHDPLGRLFDPENPEEPYPDGVTSGIRLANEIEGGGGGGTIVDITTKMEFQVPFRIDL